MTPANPLLEGIRILDLSRLLPGPFCSLYLAQMGAEVIKIEEPQGGDYARGMGQMFALVNRGKKSVTLDLRNAQDREAFLTLADSADVILESFRPGVMDKLGCGYQTLRARNPRLVYAAITGYGQNGPYRDWAGHDMNYLAYAGVLDQIGNAGHRPAISNVQIADLAGGALTCAMGILAAVIGAQKSGQGTMVDVSMMEGAMALQPIALAALREDGEIPARGAGILTGALPNYQVYRCRDGQYLAVGALEPKFFIRMLTVIGNDLPAPLRALLPKKSAGRSAGGKTRSSDKNPFGKLDKLFGNAKRARMVGAPIRLALAGLFMTRTRDQWAALLADQDACVAPVLRLDEALHDPQVRARQLIEDDGGKPAFGLPIKFDHPRAPLPPAPALGADTESVLAATSAGKSA
ncbi:CaiB/BaiF CoA-transferase family protein [Sinimarinibacterium sp. NLF-5-8]|uniref:CaiB/BaiF CoA transferase family protein n=1 Tax=Sinimarinibacterium sp. NLF-5-8 TaxID=2698684 RepID=UPI00137C0661|nr:CoA transferase [Sinimarinibacterium sp. NLF-5-8]QHS09466.1 CoA transferase [Sinimarinibacterium sp. NLF-5-8]